MRRILLLVAGAAILALPASAAARPESHAHRPGFLVVRNASTDAGVLGKPVATVVVGGNPNSPGGFVLGHIAQEGKVQIYHLASSGSVAAQVAGVDVSRRAVTWHGVPGTEFSGSDFRFRAVGGVWRVVVYGAGISLYAGGVGHASLHGSVSYPGADGLYSFNGERFASLPSGVVTQQLGKK
jgi:hypothetical protein